MAPESSTTTAGIERYCQLADQLEAAVNQGVAQGGAGDGSGDVVMDALQRNDALVGQTVRAAAPEVREDVAIVLADLGARVGSADQAPEPAEAAASLERVIRFEDENCPR